MRGIISVRFVCGDCGKPVECSVTEETFFGIVNSQPVAEAEKLLCKKCLVEEYGVIGEECEWQ